MNSLLSKALIVLLTANIVAAAVVSCTFTGTLTEGFESFGYGPRNPTSIFGGIGSITDPAGYVVNDYGWGLAGPSGRVHGGSYMWGHNTGANGVVRIDFTQTITAFGGWFAYAISVPAPALTFTFYGSGGVNLGSGTLTYDANANSGRMVYAGFCLSNSAMAASYVIISNDYYHIMDDIAITTGTIVQPPPPPPTPTCGNLIIETGEACDGGACCATNCQFASTATLCRASAGVCDAAEYCSGTASTCPSDSFMSSATACRGSTGACDRTEFCTGSSIACPSDVFAPSSQVCRAAVSVCDVQESCTGSSASCPSDAFQPSTFACNEDFGVCDVKRRRTCTGNTAVCSGFEVPYLNRSTVQWLAYSVVSFGNLNADTGSIGGRLAVKGDTQITGGFSVGSEITPLPANLNPGIVPYPINYAFIGGHSVSWTDGTLSPDATSDAPEYGYAGSFSGADGLASRFVGSGADLDGYFDNAQAYYTAISNYLAAEPANAAATSEWSGVMISCSAASNSYVLNLDSSLLEGATWWSVDQTCSYGATWVINVVGNGNVVFQGGDFPGIGERVLFNVVGSRSVSIISRVNGNILAATSTVSQTGGVVSGILIAGTISNILSATLANCEDFKPFVIVAPVIASIQAGQTNIPLASFSQLIAGDVVTIGNDAKGYTITARRTSANGQDSIDVSPALEASYDARTFVKTTVANPLAARTQDSIQVDKEGSASSIVMSILVIVAAMLF